MNWLIPSLLVIIPSLFTASYFSGRFRELSVISAAVTLLLALAINLLRLKEADFFLVDSLSRILMLTVSSVYLLSTLFALGYHHNLGESRNMRVHLSMMHIFAASMLFSLAVNNYGLLWIGVEATTITSALLLVIEEDALNVEAAWRYVIIVSAGLAISLISIIMIYDAFGTLEISELIAIHHAMNTTVEIAAATALIGFGTKAGLAPMHGWLPDAHSEAPSEISSMFSGVLLPVALFALYRVYQIAYSPGIEQLFLFFALLTLVVVALLLPSQRFYKRMFAYSTMENMALILIGFVVGGIGYLGAVILLVSHAFGKAGAFYSSGNVLSVFKTKRIDRVTGLRDSMPQTSASLLLSALAVTGSPPFGAFIGEIFIFFAVIRHGFFLAAAVMLVTLLISFSAINMKVGGMVFSGPSETMKNEAGLLQRSVAIVSVGISALVTLLYLLAGGV